MGAYEYIDNKLKQCPRCLHSMRHVKGNGVIFWVCHNCDLMQLEDGSLLDSYGSIPKEETYMWPIDELT